MITPRETSSINKHFQEVRKVQTYSIAEQEELATLAHQGDLEARTAIINANLALVLHLAKKYPMKGVEYEDLVAAGNEGLIYAIEKYKLGNNFVSWCHTCITKFILLYLTNNTHTVKLTHFLQKQGNDPLNIKSFDDIRPGTDDLTYEDMLPGSIEQEEEYERDDYNTNMKEVLVNNLQHLTKRQRVVIELIYFDGLTRSEAAKQLGKTRPLVDALHKKAIDKLRILLLQPTDKQGIKKI